MEFYNMAMTESFVDINFHAHLEATKNLSKTIQSYGKEIVIVYNLLSYIAYVPFPFGEV